MFDEVFPHNCSVAALDEDGKILAIRLAQIRSRDQWMSWILDKVFKVICTSRILGSWFLGETMGSNSFIIQKLSDILKYDVWRMFDILKCDKIYQAKVVCSARFHGIKGLGTEIVQRSEALALDLGCTHSYALVTGEGSWFIHIFRNDEQFQILGNYSQKIFTKLNYQTLTSLDYADFKDENGDLYLKDTREQTSIITCCKKLK